MRVAKYEIGDRLSGRNYPNCDYSFIVHEIEEDLETREPVYVDKDGLCFKESECKRTRKAKGVNVISSLKPELMAEIEKVDRAVCAGEFRDLKGRNPTKAEIDAIMEGQRHE